MSALSQSKRYLPNLNSTSTTSNGGVHISCPSHVGIPFKLGEQELPTRAGNEEYIIFICRLLCYDKPSYKALRNYVRARMAQKHRVAEIRRDSGRNLKKLHDFGKRMILETYEDIFEMRTWKFSPRGRNILKQIKETADDTPARLSHRWLGE